MSRFDRILDAPKNTKVPKNRRVPVPPPAKSFEDKLRDGDYTCKLPYPSRQDPDRKEKQRAYYEEEARLEGEFKKDMLAFYGVAGHPKAQRAYEIAWSHGHSAGFSEVDIYFSELSELLK